MNDLVQGDPGRGQRRSGEIDPAWIAGFGKRWDAQHGGDSGISSLPKPRDLNAAADGRPSLTIAIAASLTVVVARVNPVAEYLCRCESRSYGSPDPRRKEWINGYWRQGEARS